MKSVCAAAVGLSACAALLSVSGEASAQEIQLTGPLAGAPAVRKLRLHRKGRFEVAPGASFTILDQYLRTIIVGGTLTYHPTDWLGVGVWGGYGFQYTAGLTDELQRVANERDCGNRPFTRACQLTAVNIAPTGRLQDQQLGKIQWVIAPQISAVPFRGKLSLFSVLFFDADVNVFAGPAIIGVQERADCGATTEGGPLTPCASSFNLKNRITGTVTFGLGLNFYFLQFMNLGFDWRAMPFSWNTSGFDNYGGGANKDFPDNNVNSEDREFHFTSMLTVRLGFQFPTAIKSSE